MARARNIKPSFFMNELLVELTAYDRLLFIGLWCMADREGRIECRLKRIKMELFPCDTYDVEIGINELIRTGFLTKYTANSTTVISVVNFLKHQTPHGTERDSELPDESGNLTLAERDSKGYATGKKRRNNVKSKEDNDASPLPNSEVTVTAACKNALNPESGFLNPDVLNPERGISAPEKSLAVDNSQPKASASRLSLDFEFPEDQWGQWARTSRADILDPAAVFAKFLKLHANAESKTPEGWFACFRSFYLNERVQKPAANPQDPLSDPDSRASIESQAKAKGMGPWDQLKEHWPSYKARVIAAPLAINPPGRNLFLKKNQTIGVAHAAK